MTMMRPATDPVLKGALTDALDRIPETADLPWSRKDDIVETIAETLGAHGAADCLHVPGCACGEEF